MIGSGKCRYEICEQGFCPGIGMGLEDTPDLLMRIMSGCFKRRPDLCRVVGIVVNDSDAVYFSLIFKTPLCAGECF